MTNFVLLNNINHRNLRVIRDYLPQYGDNEMSAVTFPHEFRAVQNEYPIFFQKNPENGQFVPVALLGLRQGENLFLSTQGWDAHYIPVSVQRRPFLIGIQSKPEGVSDEKQLMVYLDMDSPRINEQQGDAVFLPHGGYSPYLDKVLNMLDYIQYGNQLNERFSKDLLQQQLIESVNIEITLKNGERNSLAGLYTINEEKMANLTPETVNEFYRQGYFEFIYMFLASHANVSKLITRLEALTLRKSDQH